MTWFEQNRTFIRFETFFQSVVIITGQIQDIRLLVQTIQLLKKESGKMTRLGNGSLDEAIERLRDEQEKNKDPKAVYQEKMLDCQDDEE